MKRGQVAIEYLLLIGVIFLAIIPVFYYAIQQSSQDVRMNEANDFASTLAKTADVVYALGPGSQDYVNVVLPGGVENISITRNEILLKVKIFGGTADIFAHSKTNLTGSLSTISGSKHISVKNINGTVRIEE